MRRRSAQLRRDPGRLDLVSARRLPKLPWQILDRQQGSIPRKKTSEDVEPRTSQANVGPDSRFLPGSAFVRIG